MGTPYMPPGTDPTGYPGPQPSRPIPTANSKLADGAQHLVQNWKSTVSSLLTIYVAVVAALTGPDLAANGITHFHAPEWFLLGGVIAKVILGVIQKDPQ